MKNTPLISVLFLSHDASRTGAPLFLLRLMRWLTEHSAVRPRLILGKGGALEDDFRALAPTVILNRTGPGKSSALRSLGRIPVVGNALKQVWRARAARSAVASADADARPPIDLVYANSVATGTFLPAAVPPGVPVLTHVHEMEDAIQICGGAPLMKTIARHTTRYLATAHLTRDNLLARHHVDPAQVDFCRTFFVPDHALIHTRAAVRQQTRAALNIPDAAFFIAGCGPVSKRKGTDLFVAAAIDLARRSPRFHFLWVGLSDTGEFATQLRNQIAAAGDLRSRFHFISETPTPMTYFAAADLFALTSREEPLGMVGIEAASLSVPVACFANVGDMPRFVEKDAGLIVDTLDSHALAEKIAAIADHPAWLAAAGARAAQKALALHDIEIIAPQILSFMKHTIDSGKAAARPIATAEASPT